jgi:hypothetical protein
MFRQSRLGPRILSRKESASAEHAEHGNYAV